MNPRRLRVLVVTNLFADPFGPGRATFNQQQFSRLAQHAEVRVLVPVSWLEVLRRPLAYRRLRREALERWPMADYVLYVYIPGVARWLHAASLWLSLLTQRLPTMLSRRWDVVLASWAYPDAVAVAGFSAISGVPCVVKVHGTDVNGFTLDRGRRAQIRWALQRARHVVAVSAALATRVSELGVAPDRVSVLYNGVDPERFAPRPQSESRAALGIQASDRVVLFVGNVQASKGCAELLETHAQLSSSIAGLQLVFAGDGPLLADLRARAASLGVVASVHFVGRVAHERMVQWFTAADVLCLPSHMEGVPNVVLEAMACGTPVVATRVGGIPEVLPEWAGSMVPPHDAAALQAALFTALHARWDHERIVAHARGFNWDNNVEQLLLKLQEAAGPAGDARVAP